MAIVCKDKPPPLIPLNLSKGHMQREKDPFVHVMGMAACFGLFATDKTPALVKKKNPEGGCETVSTVFY